MFNSEVLDSVNDCNAGRVCRYSRVSGCAKEGRLSRTQFGIFSSLEFNFIPIHHYPVTKFLQTGAQCIHLAAKSGSLETLQLMISYGADVNARTDPQLLQSPLHFAASNPTFEACQILLAHGADLMAQDAVRVVSHDKGHGYASLNI